MSLEEYVELLRFILCRHIVLEGVQLEEDLLQTPVAETTLSKEVQLQSLRQNIFQVVGGIISFAPQ